MQLPPNARARPFWSGYPILEPDADEWLFELLGADFTDPIPSHPPHCRYVAPPLYYGLDEWFRVSNGHWVYREPPEPPDETRKEPTRRPPKPNAKERAQVTTVAHPPPPRMFSDAIEASAYNASVVRPNVGMVFGMPGVRWTYMGSSYDRDGHLVAIEERDGERAATKIDGPSLFAILGEFWDGP